MKEIKMDYNELKRLIKEDFQIFIEEDGYSPVQAIAATMEGSIRQIKKDKKSYIPTILILALLSLQNGFIPDYLIDRVKNLESKNNYDPSKEEYEQFLSDKKVVDELLNRKKYYIDSDESYKARANMLLDL